MSINPEDLISQETLAEVHLHPAEGGQEMALSPNNQAFLLNLTFPVVNFTIILYQDFKRLSIFNITISNSESFASGQLEIALS